MLHIGNSVKAVLHERGISVAAFARALPCSRENAFRILRRSDMDTALLRRICLVLDHDFFADLSRAGDYGGKKDL